MKNNIFGGYGVQFGQNIVISDDIELSLNVDLKPGFMQCVHQLGQGKIMIQPTPTRIHFLKSNEITVK